MQGGTFSGDPQPRHTSCFPSVLLQELPWPFPVGSYCSLDLEEGMFMGLVFLLFKNIDND